MQFVTQLKHLFFQAHEQLLPRSQRMAGIGIPVAAAGCQFAEVLLDAVQNVLGYVAQLLQFGACSCGVKVARQHLQQAPLLQVQLLQRGPHVVRRVVANESRPCQRFDFRRRPPAFDQPYRDIQGRQAGGPH